MGTLKPKNNINFKGLEALLNNNYMLFNFYIIFSMRHIR